MYHYPKCSTSQAGLSFLRSKGFNPEIILYCESGLTKEEILHLMKLLNLSHPIEIIKRRGITYRNLGLAHKTLSDEELIDIIIQNPKLLERPIVIVSDKKAVIGKTQEIISDII